MANKIITHPATPEFRDGWDRIFGKKARWVEEMYIGVDLAAGMDQTVFADQCQQYPIAAHDDRQCEGVVASEAAYWAMRAKA